MTSVWVGVEPLVGRGNGVNPKAGAFQRVARIEPDQPFARQPQLHGVIEDRLGQHEHRPWRGRQQVGQRPRIEVVGMLVAREDRDRLSSSSWPRMGARVMRTCGRPVASYFWVRCSER